MKSVAIISTVTFLLIFGGIAGLSLHMAKITGGEEPTDPNDVAAGQRLMAGIAAERDRLQTERELLAGYEQSQAARAVLMNNVHDQLLGVVRQIEDKQDAYISEQDAAAAKLAKMYEAMKPAKAAVILSTMDMEVTLSVLKRMKERQAAKILAQMDAGLAARLSTRLSLQEGA